METGIVRLELDGKWDLTDLSKLTSVYTQLYSISYSLQPIESRRLDEDMDEIYTKFPWRGGYSAVNFYERLFYQIPPKERPKLESIHYSSPGHMELMEVVTVAAMIAATVRFIAGSVNQIHDTYRRIQKASQDYKLGKINVKQEELKLSESQLRFIREAIDEMSRALNLTREERRLLAKRTDGNDLAQLKILSSYYRRIKKLVDLHLEGKLFME
jgi:hypothetical protein